MYDPQNPNDVRHPLNPLNNIGSSGGGDDDGGGSGCGIGLLIVLAIIVGMAAICGSLSGDEEDEKSIVSLTPTTTAENLPPTPHEVGQIVPTSSPSPSLSSTNLVVVDDQPKQEMLEQLSDTAIPDPIKLLANGYEKHAELPFEERLERIRDINVNSTGIFVRISQRDGTNVSLRHFGLNGELLSETSLELDSDAAGSVTLDQAKKQEVRDTYSTCRASRKWFKLGESLVSHDCQITVDSISAKTTNLACLSSSVISSNLVVLSNCTGDPVGEGSNPFGQNAVSWGGEFLLYSDTVIVRPNSSDSRSFGLLRQFDFTRDFGFQSCSIDDGDSTNHHISCDDVVSVPATWPDGGWGDLLYSDATHLYATFQGAQMRARWSDIDGTTLPPASLVFETFDERWRNFSWHTGNLAYGDGHVVRWFQGINQTWHSIELLRNGEFSEIANQPGCSVIFAAFNAEEIYCTNLLPGYLGVSNMDGTIKSEVGWPGFILDVDSGGQIYSIDGQTVVAGRVSSESTILAETSRSFDEILAEQLTLTNRLFRAMAGSEWFDHLKRSEVTDAWTEKPLSSIMPEFFGVIATGASSAVLNGMGLLPCSIDSPIRQETEKIVGCNENSSIIIYTDSEDLGWRNRIDYLSDDGDLVYSVWLPQERFRPSGDNNSAPILEPLISMSGDQPGDWVITSRRIYRLISE